MKTYVGSYSKHFIFLITYEWAQFLRVFVSVKPFKPSLMFVVKAGKDLHSIPNLRLSRMFADKAGAYPSEAPFRYSTLG